MFVGNRKNKNIDNFLSDSDFKKNFAVVQEGLSQKIASQPGLSFVLHRNFLFFINMQCLIFVKCIMSNICHLYNLKYFAYIQFLVFCKHHMFNIGKI